LTPDKIVLATCGGKSELGTLGEFGEELMGVPVVDENGVTDLDVPGIVAVDGAGASDINVVRK
jgi:hypothetical protein